MKVWKKISGVPFRNLSDSGYEKVQTLAGVKGVSGKRVPLDVHLEEGDPRLVEIERVLVDEGLKASPAFSTEPVNWDTYHEERARSYTYGLDRRYEMGDLKEFAFATVEYLAGVWDDPEKPESLIFQAEQGLAPVMVSGRQKVIVDQVAAKVFRESMGDEVEFVEVKVRGGGKRAGTGHWWMKPRHVMPGLSITRNQFYNFDGQLCEYGYKEGFYVYKGNYASAEFVYDKRDFERVKNWKIAGTVENLGFGNVKGSQAIWSGAIVELMHQNQWLEGWYPVRFE